MAEVKHIRLNLKGSIFSARNKRAPAAMKILKKELKRKLKTETLSISHLVNEEIWKRGIRTPPTKLSIQSLEQDGVFYIELEGKELKLPTNKEEKKKKVAKPKTEKKETKTETTLETKKVKKEEKVEKTEAVKTKKPVEKKTQKPVKKEPVKEEKKIEEKKSEPKKEGVKTKKTIKSKKIPKTEEKKPIEN